jgi:hypothetical protein
MNMAPQTAIADFRPSCFSGRSGLDGSLPSEDDAILILMSPGPKPQVSMHRAELKLPNPVDIKTNETWDDEVDKIGIPSAHLRNSPLTEILSHHMILLFIRVFNLDNGVVGQAVLVHEGDPHRRPREIYLPPKSISILSPVVVPLHEYLGQLVYRDTGPF